MLSSTSVPELGSLQMSRRPPRSLARSCMPCKPQCPGRLRVEEEMIVILGLVVPERATALRPNSEPGPNPESRIQDPEPAKLRTPDRGDSRPFCRVPWSPPPGKGSHRQGFY